MATVRVTVTGQAALAKRLKLVGDDAVSAFRIAVNSGAMAVDRTAKQLIHRGPKTGIIYVRKGKGGRKIIHHASAPGEPPASDTGYLADHIAVVMDMDGLGANVESQADYSRALEFGTMKMRARPFMTPAFESNKDRIKKAMAAALKKAVKGK